MREYELTIIIQPEISEEGSQTILGKLDTILEAGSASKLLCEDLGKRKLAYEIRRFQKGHYFMLNFLDEGQVVPEVERALRLEESVLRFLTVKVDENVADVEGRKAQAKEQQAELERRAAEKAAREAEEATARAEAERVAAAEAERAGAAAAEAAERAGGDEDDAAEASMDDEAGEDADEDASDEEDES